MYLRGNATAVFSVPGIKFVSSLVKVRAGQLAASAAVTDGHSLDIVTRWLSLCELAASAPPPSTHQFRARWYMAAYDDAAIYDSLSTRVQPLSGFIQFLARFLL